MDIQTAFYHGIRHNIRRVLTALGPARVDKAMTAFDDGASNWNECFFARAFKGELDLSADLSTDKEFQWEKQFPKADAPEIKIMAALDIPSVVPIRLVWHTFDSHSKLITREQLQKFVADVQNEAYAASADEFLKQFDFTTEVEETPMVVTCG